MDVHGISRIMRNLFDVRKCPWKSMATCNGVGPFEWLRVECAMFIEIVRWKHEQIKCSQVLEFRRKITQLFNTTEVYPRGPQRSHLGNPILAIHPVLAILATKPVFNFPILALHPTSPSHAAQPRFGSPSSPATSASHDPASTAVCQPPHAAQPQPNSSPPFWTDRSNHPVHPSQPCATTPTRLASQVNQSRQLSPSTPFQASWVRQLGQATRSTSNEKQVLQQQYPTQVGFSVA